MSKVFLIPLISYFLGAVPFGYMLVRFTEGTDIRAVGSGNIGATNVFRKNRWAGILTLVLDAGKGYLAVLVSVWLGGDVQWNAIAAVAAILGHMFTVFLGFKGGKGVATAAGAYLAVSPLPVAAALVLFLAVAIVSRYVSLASVLAAGAFPIGAYMNDEPTAVVVWAGIGSAFIIAKHHENIRRLLSGNENRFAPGKRS